MLALTIHDARQWEPKRLRLRLFTIPATIARAPSRRSYTYPTLPPGPRLSPKLSTDSTTSQPRPPVPSRPAPDHPGPWNLHPVMTTRYL